MGKPTEIPKSVYNDKSSVLLLTFPTPLGILETMKTFEGYTAYSYRRFSSAGQRHGDIERQIRSARQVATELGAGFNSDLVIDDSAVSSFRGKNIDPNIGQLGAFIQLAKNKSIPPKSLLIIEHLDRFSRAGIGKALPVFIGLLENGVTVYSMIEQIVYSPKDVNDIGKMIQALVSFAAANDFSAKLSQRVSAARQEMLKKAINGELINVGSFKPAWLSWNEKTNLYEPNEFFSITKQIFADYIDGSSAHSIAADLQTKNIPCFSHGKAWSAGMVISYLRNEAAKGFFRGKPYFNISVVSEKDYSITQGILTTRKSIHGRTSDHFNFLKHILVCNHCGGNVNLSQNVSHGIKCHYYRCCKWTKKACNAGHQARSYALEFSVLTNVGRNPDKLISTTTSNEKAVLASLQEREKAITKRIQLLLDTDVDLVDLKLKLTELKTERESIRNSIEVLNGNLSLTNNPESVVEDLNSLIGDKAQLVQWFVTLDKVLKNPESRQKLTRIIPALVKTVVVDFHNQTQTTILKNGFTFQPVCFRDKGISEGLS